MIPVSRTFTHLAYRAHQGKNTLQQYNKRDGEKNRRKNIIVMSIRRKRSSYVSDTQKHRRELQLCGNNFDTS